MQKNSFVWLWYNLILQILKLKIQNEDENENDIEIKINNNEYIPGQLIVRQRIQGNKEIRYWNLNQMHHYNASLQCNNNENNSS